MNTCKFITLERILIILIVIIAGGLLIHNRTATESQLSAINRQTGDIIKRGEIMTTSDDYAVFNIDNSTVYLSKNTQVKLVDGRQGNIDLQLIQGRIVLDGNANISVREVNISTKGQVSVVHYSWLDEIEAAPIIGLATVQYSDQSRFLDPQAIRMSTLDPYATEFIDFNPSQSSEKDFYDWVGLDT
ncbi:hypothetical protein KJ673_00845 [Patescibacteria group bacterium]|nr:hypothetical protein [Patescibacteria group bacterium]MBU4453222.1 hypothetical protein [Patescibacteria group bacterium]MCG2687270.1 hypothetical protein [Candidatus Parcubacteria bacterium]